MNNTNKIIPLAILSIYSFANNSWADDNKSQGLNLSPVVVTATRMEQNSFDLPVSIDVVDQSHIQDGKMGISLAESLISVPGVTAQSRGQFAQDTQISTRGFGARSAFGVRGVRLIVDGIPLTMPDGIGQPGNVDIGTLKSIEVMRGPFSALYGSSSGGVIQLFTETPRLDKEITTSFTAGSYGTRKEDVSSTGTVNGIGYLVDYSKYETEGYRQNSSASKDQGTAKFGIVLDQGTKINFLAEYINLTAQDPMGLSRATAFTSPNLAAPGATTTNARVHKENTQVGINVEHSINENNTLNFVVYGGHRNNIQYLPTDGSTTSTAGKASSISRDFYGTDIRWTNNGLFFNKKYSVSSGMSAGYMTDDRLDISAVSGIATSTISRLETDSGHNFDQYFQAQWNLAEPFDLHGGIRHSQVQFDVDDRKVGGTNNGHTFYEKTTSVAGVVWKALPTLNIYANYGQGFETPTLIEIAYSTSGGAGPNLGLKPSTSDNYEVGAKAFILENTRLNLAVFKTNTQQEIITKSGGTYSVYNNAPNTVREGIEISIDSSLPYNFGAYASYSLLDATFNSAFTGSAGLVNKGNKIPGTYRQQGYAELSWKNPDLGFKTALEGRYNSQTYVNDINSDTAPAYTILNIRGGFEQKLSSWKLTEYVRIENILDKNYIGAIRPNDSKSLFFESGAGRNWLLGINASFQF